MMIVPIDLYHYTESLNEKYNTNINVEQEEIYSFAKLLKRLEKVLTKNDFENEYKEMLEVCKYNIYAASYNMSGIQFEEQELAEVENTYKAIKKAQIDKKKNKHKFDFFL